MRTSISGLALGIMLATASLLLGSCSSSGPGTTGTTTSHSSSSAPKASGASGTSGTAPNAAGASATNGAVKSSNSANTGPAGGTGDAAAVGAIASKLHTGEGQTFDATYKATTSSGSQTIEYAANPPAGYLFKSTDSKGNVNEILGIVKTTYACRGAKKDPLTCSKLDASATGRYQLLLQIYTGKFWYNELNSLEAAAAAAGIKYSTSTMSAAGQTLQCLTYRPKTGSGGEVCVTSSGVIGYVKDFSSVTTFELTSYSNTVSPSLLELPAGATVTSF